MSYDPCDILVVEDNPNDAELLLRSLKKNKLANNLYFVKDGEEALNFLFCKEEYSERKSYKNPKVIFLDLKLPKLNGLEVLEEIKTNPLTKKIPVIIVSSSREDPDIESAYELGANSYVVKPVKFNDFMETAKQLGLYWLLVNQHPE